MCCGYSSIQIFRIRVEWLALLLQVKEAILGISDRDVLILHEVEQTADVAPQSRLLFVFGKRRLFLLLPSLRLRLGLGSFWLPFWPSLLLPAWSLSLLWLRLLAAFWLSLLDRLLRLILTLSAVLVLLLLVSGLGFRLASLRIPLLSTGLRLPSSRRRSGFWLVVPSLRSLRGWSPLLRHLFPALRHVWLRKARPLLARRPLLAVEGVLHLTADHPLGLFGLLDT